MKQNEMIEIFTEFLYEKISENIKPLFYKDSFKLYEDLTKEFSYKLAKKILDDTSLTLEEFNEKFKSN